MALMPTLPTPLLLIHLLISTEHPSERLLLSSRSQNALQREVFSVYNRNNQILLPRRTSTTSTVLLWSEPGNV
jgi:hypothetical protein